ncbi:hypothetical protein [Atopobium fossor]|uniref:hypothetical protein n=1 Tax=Atopobium fossor TaxID=39487 RepID=UPI00040044C5|nr:hypothetical protein [Atopobium fossor]
MISKTGAVVAGLLAVSLGVGGFTLANQPKQQTVTHTSTAITTTPFQQKQGNYAADTTTQVLIDAPAVSSDEIVKIIKHGDHWHVFTKDGREIITYSDPTKAGSVANLKNTARVLEGDSLKRLDPNTVVRLLKHDNHWHIITAGGAEFITYEDPRPYYPNAAVGEYVGNHGDRRNYGGSGNGNGNTYQAGHQTNQGGQGGSSSNQGGSLPGNPGLHTVRVVNLDELRRLPITKILRHDDHWHCYTADNTEYITKDDPTGVFPGIVIGEYHGNHGDHGDHSKPQPPRGPIVQDPNDPKRVIGIEHHENHWHLHHADGTESITYEDPSALYPDIKIEEYDPNHGHKFDPLDQSEKFSYDEVKPKLIVDIKTITYGNLIHANGFDRNRNAFVIPHHDHYHYITLETIIQGCKDSYFASAFGNASARDVVATIKYLIANPEARPKGENGWGSDSSIGKTPSPDAGGNTDNQNGSDDDHEHPAKKATRIIAAAKNIWLVYYEDGTTEEFTYDPSYKWPGIQVEKPQSNKPNGNMTQEEIIAKWSKIYGMTRDEFEEAYLNLPYIPIEDIQFNMDGTVIVYGKKYQFKPVAEQPEKPAETDSKSDTNVDTNTDTDSADSDMDEIDKTDQVDQIDEPDNTNHADVNTNTDTSTDASAESAGTE